MDKRFKQELINVLLKLSIDISKLSALKSEEYTCHDLDNCLNIITTLSEHFLNFFMPLLDCSFGNF